MYRVQNNTCKPIVVGNVTIPAYGFKLIESYSNTAVVNRLLNSHSISITYVKISKKSTATADTSEDVSDGNKKNSNANNTRISNKKKNIKNESSADQSDILKGDINNATD